MTEPKLRFRQDDGTEYPSWCTKPLGDIATCLKGAPLSKADISENGIPLILYGELYTTYGEVATNIVRRTKKTVSDECISRIGDVLIPTSGETPEEISTATCVMVPGVILAGDLYIVRNNALDGCILSYILNHQVNGNIAKIAQGKSIVHLRWDDLKKINITYPFATEEQKKIVDFLSNVDMVISGLKSEIETFKQQKKGIIQKLFSQEIRFKQNDGTEYPAWITFPMSNLIYASGKKNSNNTDLETYSVNNEKGFIPQSEQFEAAGYLENTNKKLYYIVSPGSFAYNPARINVGSIGYLETDYNVLVSSLYEVFKTYDKLNDKFLWYWFHSSAFQRAVHKYSEGGVRKYFFFDKMLEVKIDLPCLEEQQKIADFLSSFDEAIAITRQELEKWELLKKGLMQQMFV